MIRGRVVGALAVEAGDGAATDACERDQMPLPTLDERANLYLRAVYGDRDFTNEEYSRARNLMLKAMTADIVARSNARSLDGASLEAPEQLSLANPFLEVRALESSYEPGTVHGSSTGVGFSDHRASRQAVEGSPKGVLREFQGFPHIRLPPVFSGIRAAKHTIAAYAAVALAAVAVFWLTAVLSAAWFAPNAPSHDHRAAVQPSQPDSSGRTPPVPGRYTLAEAEAQREVISALNAAQLGPDEIGALLKRGQELIAAGKFRLARLVLEQAAEAGSAPAALALGRTYDPTLLERSGVRPDAAPDTAMAWAWYQKAKHLGSAEAARRLGQLPPPR